MIALDSIERRLTALEGAMHQVLRIGVVTLQLPEKGKVRVRLIDADCLETYELTVLYPATYMDKAYRMPDIDEQVVCLFVPFADGLQKGFVLGAIYSDPDPVPVSCPNKTHMRWVDGTWMEYDRAEGKMQIHCRGKLIIAAGEGVEFLTPVVRLPYQMTGPGEPDLKPIEVIHQETECDG
ncbi:phage baseplate assembly protein V [Dethiosulfatarculus sandiegensis]|uniref:Baseplate protein n=1 Tax=Dethiosulfatarculus sandiegensis TaxID=1429043 RepID=A0A0D2JZP5_9BACT|nr:phage baseplate assembly protein V [Dethiosulfatarculus sandiegensis]KIX14985.1 baseplate protein [Dethiosulfatarculus sandiegensis]